MPIDYITNVDPLFWARTPIQTTNYAAPPGEYILSDSAGQIYVHNYGLTPEDYGKLINWRVEYEAAFTCTTEKPQEEEEFDTTEIEKYIDSLEKEVVGTEN